MKKLNMHTPSNSQKKIDIIHKFFPNCVTEGV